MELQEQRMQLREGNGNTLIRVWSKAKLGSCAARRLAA
jgi:hypothetical protein